MKLRILDNSIRFRLSVKDLKDLSEKGTVTASIKITPERSFIYSLRTSDQSDQIVAEYIDNELIFYLPISQVLHLSNSEEIGIYERIKHNNLSILKVTIEKDFKCLTPRQEDESGLFPNPRTTHSEC